MGGDYSAGFRVEVPKPRLSKKLRLWLLLVFSGLPLLVIYLCTRPVIRLANNPPAEFFDDRPEWDAQRRDGERRLAFAYWEKAVNVIQWDYFYGSDLPEQPPPKFQVDVKQLPGAMRVPPDTRQRYWRQLRRVWGLQRNWKESYEWNTDWLTRIFHFFTRKP